MPVRKSFHYLPPKSFPEDTRPGCRIKVPFGNKTLTGILIDYSSKTITDEAKLKRAEELLDSSPILPKGVFELCVWARQYYHHPVGEVLAAAIPSLLRKGHSSIMEIEQFFLTMEGQNLEADSLRNAPRQKEVIDLFHQTSGGLSRKDLGHIPIKIIQSLID